MLSVDDKLREFIMPIFKKKPNIVSVIMSKKKRNLLTFSNGSILKDKLTGRNYCLIDDFDHNTYQLQG